MKKFLLGMALLVGMPLLLLLALMIVVGQMMAAGSIPDTAIVTGDKLSGKAKQSIAASVQFRPGETIQYFYSAAMFDWSSDGNLITNQRVVSYVSTEGATYMEEADYADIARLVPEFDDEWAADSTLTIVTHDDREFDLLLSNEAGLDHTAVEYVEQRVKEARGE